jgi:hypothetical protein
MHARLSLHDYIVGNQSTLVSEELPVLCARGDDDWTNRQRKGLRSYCCMDCEAPVRASVYKGPQGVGKLDCPLVRVNCQYSHSLPPSEMLFGSIARADD